MERLSKIVVALWGTVVKRLSKKGLLETIFFIWQKREKWSWKDRKGRFFSLSLWDQVPRATFSLKCSVAVVATILRILSCRSFFFGVEVTTFSRVRQHVFYQTCRIFVKSYFSECHFWSNLEKDMTFAFVLKSQTYHFTFQITDFWRQNLSSIDL